MQIKSEYLSYSVSYIAKYLAKNTKYSRFCARENGIEFTNEQPPVIIDFFDFSRPISVQSGWFWNVLIFSTREFQIKFGGIEKEKSEHICLTINRFIKSLTEKKLKEIELTIGQATIDAHKLHLLNSNYYIRHNQANEWISTYQWLTIHLKNPNLLKKFTSNSQKKLELIKPLLENDLNHIKQLNDNFVAKQLIEYNGYLDTIETNPLTENQRKACVIDEKFNLVLAGAGTGKTSTMIGRAGYLLKSGLAKPEEILMLAYGKDAAKEMDERIRSKLGIKDITVKTFHSLGMEIIGKVEGTKPSISKMAIDEKLRTKFIDEQFEQLRKNEDYQSLLIEYFANLIYPYKSQFQFKSLNEYTAYILENDIRTLQGERVKSYEECEIANFLYRQGVKYQYEAKYKIDTRTAEFKQYCPDFYLTDYDIYIEHFAVDEQDRTPPFIEQSKYVAGMKWKREQHQKNQTKLVETYSYYKRQGRLTDELHKNLTAEVVKYNPLAANQLLENLNTQNHISDFSKLIASILALIKSAGLGLQQLDEKFANSNNKARAEAMFQLFKPIYKAYEEELKRTDSIDFDDMITRAIQYIERGQYTSPHLYILVDEFQDISASRARLIKALMAQQANCSLFCVGDDWQAIYRFSGSDVSLTKDFSTHFGYTATSILDKTFRFNNKIGEVASRFISENPSQIQKIIHSHSQVDASAVSLIKTNNNEMGLEAALKAISEKVSKNASVLLLGRFIFDDPKNLNDYCKQYPNLTLKFMTAHSSKGKEADYVIVLNLIKGKHGFPSEKSTNPLLELLLPKPEPFKHAEERRLFYVALTRARHHVYLITDASKPSSFIVELIDSGYPILTDEFKGRDFQDQLANPCPSCKTGFLVARDGYSSFFGCSNYPVCKHTEHACKWCGSALKTKGELKICGNTICDFKEPICPNCGGAMVFRKNGNFWGCSNYKRDHEFSCGYTTKFIDLRA
ncbi:MAG: UvrD-helicase domain-containing protein [Methylotenera sp.]|nr:UvrD-helicase domain-containing protein [Methylotenera sp.]MDD4925972.1 UvrD-helicase domain-containing protein [Methylotenera sp.]